MKITLLTTILSFITLNTIVSAQGATTETKPTTTPASAENEVNVRTTNMITLEILSHIREVFITSATATDLEKAKLAATKVNEITDKIIKNHNELKASPMPTVAEKKSLAQKMLQYEPQVVIIMQKMTNTFNSNTEEINKVIEPAIMGFKNKTTNTISFINTYYPKEEMTTYINELKEK